MSNINIDINAADSSSEGSSVDIRVIPSNEGQTEAPSGDLELSCNSGKKQRMCVVKIQVETPFPRARLINQAKGVTVRLLQSNLHRVRTCAPEDIEQKKDSLNPNKDSMQVWSLANCMPRKFEMETQERKAIDPLKRPASPTPGSPQQEAEGPREASRRLNHQTNLIGRGQETPLGDSRNRPKSSMSGQSSLPTERGLQQQQKHPSGSFQ